MIVRNPKTLEEALRFLGETPASRIVAGGTDLIPRLNQKLEAYEVLCYIDGYPEMQGIERQADGSVRVGALVRLTDAAEAPELAPYAAVTEAASRVASPQIRNQATIGGNILQENRCMFFNNQVPWSDVNRCFKWGGDRCYQYKSSKECVALFQSDIAPALMAWGAQALIQGKGGERRLPVGELYLPAGAKNIAHDEILTGILLPAPGEGEISRYVRKTMRGSFDFPLVSCAVRVRVEADIIRDAAIVFGAAGVMPAALEQAPPLLTGKPATEFPSIAEEMESSIRKAVKAFRDTRVDAGVRVDMAKSVYRKAVQSVLLAMRAN